MRQDSTLRRSAELIPHHIGHRFNVRYLTRVGLTSFP